MGTEALIATAIGLAMLGITIKESIWEQKYILD
jgi:hypothetical protein